MAELTINLAAARANLDRLRHRLAPVSRIMLVAKSDFYGLGLDVAARLLDGREGGQDVPQHPALLVAIARLAEHAAPGEPDEGPAGGPDHAHADRAVGGAQGRDAPGFDLARDQSVADVVQSRAAVVGRDGRAQQPERPHLAEDGRIGLLVAERFQDARRELFLRVAPRGIAHHAFLLGQLVFQQQRVVPLERCFALRGGTGGGHEGTCGVMRRGRARFYAAPPLGPGWLGIRANEARRRG